jgi:hypothetical protein
MELIGFLVNPEDKKLLVETSRRHRITLSDLIRLLVFRSLESFDSEKGL